MIAGNLLSQEAIFTKEYYLTRENVSAFAHTCEDYNPLHHDAAFATQTRFSGLIACGPQYASLLLGLAATHFSQYGATLGLEFNLKFVKAAGDALRKSRHARSSQKRDELLAHAARRIAVAMRKWMGEQVARFWPNPSGRCFAGDPRRCETRQGTQPCLGFRA
jgi:acyl dehydratase